MLSGNSNLGIRIVCDLSGVFSLRTKIKKNLVSKCVTWASTLWLNHDPVMRAHTECAPAADAFRGHSWLSLGKVDVAVQSWRCTFKGPRCGTMIHITSTEQSTCRAFSPEENQAGKSLLGQEAANRCDMKFLLESVTLLGILLVFSTHKTWKSHWKQKAQTQSRLPGFPHLSKPPGIKGCHLCFCTSYETGEKGVQLAASI